MKDKGGIKVVEFDKEGFVKSFDWYSFLTLFALIVIGAIVEWIVIITEGVWIPWTLLYGIFITGLMLVLYYLNNRRVYYKKGAKKK